jgi:hypothetical protein
VASDIELADRIDLGTAFIFAEMTRRTPGGRVMRQDGLLLAIGSDPSPVIVNTILPVAPTVNPEAVARALGMFAAIDHVPSILTRDHRDGALTEAFAGSGYRRLVSLPGMVLEARLPEEPAPAGVSIHRVATEADRVRWIEGNLYGFAEDDGDPAALRSTCQTVESLSGGPVTWSVPTQPTTAT